MLIYIDPGHGLDNPGAGKGYDPGASAGGMEEAATALVWAATLKFLLVQVGCKVALTRTSAADPAPLGSRVRRANQAGAGLYISLHLNAASAATARGTETLYRDAADQKLAQVIQGAAIKAFRTFDPAWKDRGVKSEKESARGTLCVFGASMPCALLEIGFVSNAQDRALMQRKDVRVAVCQAVVDALVGAYSLGAAS